MNVDKETFLKDVATLKARRVIVLDKEIVDNTGVAKTALSMTAELNYYAPNR